MSEPKCNCEGIEDMNYDELMLYMKNIGDCNDSLRWLREKGYLKPAGVRAGICTHWLKEQDRVLKEKRSFDYRKKKKTKDSSEPIAARVPTTKRRKKDKVISKGSLDELS